MSTQNNNAAVSVKVLKQNVVNTVKNPIDKAAVTMAGEIFPAVYTAFQQTTADLGPQATGEKAYAVVYGGVLDATRGSVSETARPAVKNVLSLIACGLSPQSVGSGEMARLIGTPRSWEVSKGAQLVLRGLSYLPREQRAGAWTAWRKISLPLLTNTTKIQTAVYTWMKNAGLKPDEMFEKTEKNLVGVRLIASGKPRLVKNTKKGVRKVTPKPTAQPTVKKAAAAPTKTVSARAAAARQKTAVAKKANA